MVKRKSVRILCWSLRMVGLWALLSLVAVFMTYDAVMDPETRRRWPTMILGVLTVMLMVALAAYNRGCFIRGTVDELVVYEQGSFFHPLRIRKDLHDLALEVSIPESRDLVRLPAAQRNAARATFLVHKGRRKIAVVALAPQAPNRDAAERFEYWQRSVLGTGEPSD